jgi:hypothetical protein
MRSLSELAGLFNELPGVKWLSKRLSEAFKWLYKLLSKAFKKENDNEEDLHAKWKRHIPYSDKLVPTLTPGFRGSKQVVWLRTWSLVPFSVKSGRRWDCRKVWGCISSGRVWIMEMPFCMGNWNLLCINQANGSNALGRNCVDNKTHVDCLVDLNRGG